MNYQGLLDLLKSTTVATFSNISLPVQPVSCILASGLSATACEVVCLNYGIPVFRNPWKLEIWLTQHPGVVIGCSYKGKSAEVLDGLEIARQCGLETVYLGSGHLPGVDRAIFLECNSIPPALRHLIFVLALPYLLSGKQKDQQIASLSLVEKNIINSLIVFLANYYSSRIFVFSYSDPDIISRILSCHAIEFLRLRAFLVNFPDWTHDLLWSICSRSYQDVSLILQKPSIFLSDERFEQLVTLLNYQGFPHHVWELPNVHPIYSSFLIYSAFSHWQLAKQLKLDVDNELTFTSEINRI